MRNRLETADSASRTDASFTHPAAARGSTPTLAHLPFKLGAIDGHDPEISARDGWYTLAMGLPLGQSHRASQASSKHRSGATTPITSVGGSVLSVGVKAAEGSGREGGPAAKQRQLC
jgi:hypothetical protein